MWSLEKLPKSYINEGTHLKLGDNFLKEGQPLRLEGKLHGELEKRWGKHALGKILSGCYNDC